MITRRHLSPWSRTVGAVRARLRDAAPSRPLPSHVWPPLLDNPLPYAGLATTLATEYDYTPRIAGQLPGALQGTLYRNGPGRFERGGLRKRMLLDGDGMLQVYQFRQGQVRFRTRFVRTAKYVAEEAAGRFLYRTWSTLSPGGIWANLGLHLANQAEVTVIRRHGTLYACGGPHPYALDPETLDTRGVSTLGVPATQTRYQAHWKVDGRTGEWLHFGVAYGRTSTLHLTIFTPAGRLRAHWTVPLPRRVFLHDWLVTERSLVFILHPGFIPLGGVVAMLLGWRSPADVLRWQPACGNLVLVLDRAGPSPPRLFEAEAATEPGWLLTVVYSASTHQSALAILAADQVAAGPVAWVHLTHHVPLSFHGYWHAEA